MRTFRCRACGLVYADETPPGRCECGVKDKGIDGPLFREVEL